jgi:hypothetical protein
VFSHFLKNPYGEPNPILLVRGELAIKLLLLYFGVELFICNHYFQTCGLYHTDFYVSTFGYGALFKGIEAEQMRLMFRKFILVFGNQIVLSECKVVRYKRGYVYVMSCSEAKDTLFISV